MKNYSELELTAKILEKIPSDIKVSDYIAGTLNLSKESVYRRLKGIIPFTFEEILTLSKALGFSLDEMLKGDKSKYASIIATNNQLIGSVENGFIDIFRYHSEIMAAVNKTDNNQITISANRILGIFTSSFDHLFKFYYYKWLHQTGNTSLNYKFSDIQIPEELNDLRKKIIRYTETQRICFITDRNILHNTIKEIRYYIDRKLIDKENVTLIKDDLKAFIEKYYTFSADNILEPEGKYEVYLSSLNIENNTSYIVYDDKKLSYFWTYSDSGVYTSDTEICMLQKNWIDSLKKYSILISNSNQKMQAELYSLFSDQLETLTAQDITI